MDENQPIVPSVTPTITPPPEAPIAPVIPVVPITPLSSEGSGKSNKGLLVVLLVVVIALAVLGAVTYLALQGSGEETTVTKTTPTPTPTKVATDSAAPNGDKTTDIQRDLNQTTVTDPTTDVDGLSTEVNRL